VVRHSQSLFRLAFRITGNEADAEEVVQEAFLHGYQKLDSFQSRSSFGTWIYRIAVRCALDRMDQRKMGVAAEWQRRLTRNGSLRIRQIKAPGQNGCC